MFQHLISETLRAAGPFTAIRLLVDLEGRPCKPEDAMAVRHEVRNAAGVCVCTCLDEQTAGTIAEALSAYAPLKP